MINKKLIKKNERIFIAGSRGMAGSAILRSFQKGGYGNISNGGSIITPTSKELNLLDINQVESFFDAQKPTVVHVTVPNCGAPTIDSMHITCGYYHIRGSSTRTEVLEFKTIRGVSPFQSAHGLIGKFAQYLTLHV